MLLSHNSSSKKGSLYISLFAHITIELDGQPIEKVPTQKVAALLAYLVCNPGTHRREHLADLLWDDIPHNRFLPNLRSTLNRLPKTFKPYLITTRETITFNAPDDIWVDILAFQELADCLPKTESRQTDEYIGQLNAIEEQLIAMLDHYKGPFLDGLLLNDAPRFSDWQLIQQEHLADLALDGLRCLVDLTMHQGRYADGIAYARQMIELDPLDEKARCQLMIMLARNGDKQTAQKEYQRLVEMLDKEWGMPPAPETVRAYENLSIVDRPDPLTLSPLPTFTQSLIGRQVEIATLTHRLRMPDCRLVTIIGLGGTGKTYLAVEIARMLEEKGDFLQRIAYIPLSGIQSAERIPAVIGHAFGLFISEQDDMIHQICHYLKSKKALLIFDNFEHLLAPADAQAGHGTRNRNQTAVNIIIQLLQAAPQVKLLVTSREPLLCQQEYLFPLRGMSLPMLNTTMPLNDLRQNDAIRLFLQVASRKNSAFELAEENRNAVLQFCHLVQGTPLAIVLGAAHMDFLTPEDLVDECQESLEVLEAEWTDLPERQRSVQAIFEYSWQRLDDSLKLIFQKLSMFHGGFTTKAARQIVNASTIQLKRLHSQSLIIQTDHGRYQIHELLRQFGAQKLEQLAEQSPAKLSSVWERYMLFYLKWLDENANALAGSKPFETVAEIKPDINNIRQAWQRAAQQHNAALLIQGHKGLFILYEMQCLYKEAIDIFGYAIQMLEPHLAAVQHLEAYSILLANQSYFYMQSGHFEEAIQVVESAIRHAQSLQDDNIRKHYALSLSHWVWGMGLYMHSDHQAAYAKANQALSYAQSTSDDTLIADSLHLRGYVLFSLNQPEASIEDIRQAHNIYVQVQNRRKEINTLNQLADVKSWLHEPQVAMAYGEQALQISSEINDELRWHKSLYTVCWAALAIGEYASTEHRGQKVLGFYQDMGDRWMVANTHHQLGIVYNKLGLYDKALHHQEQSLQLSRVMNTSGDQVMDLVRVGISQNALGDHQQALILLNEAQKIADELQIDSLRGSVCTATAYTLAQLGEYSASIDMYNQAISFYQTCQPESLKLEAMAGLANTLVQSGDVRRGREHIEDLLSHLESHPENIYMFQEHFEVYLNCYHVLNACKDERAAPFLDAGYTLLQTYADRIDNPEWRSSFLENVATNREIMRLKAETTE